MRVLALFFCLCASMASATPDCEEPARTQPHDPATFDPPAKPQTTANDETAAPKSAKDLAVSARPRLRPCNLRQAAVERTKTVASEAVCGDPRIVGEYREPIYGKYRGCGIAQPVRIRSVSDVLLSQLALMDCETAVTLNTWIENTAKPAFADRGGGLKGLRLSGHYACKRQNNQPRARLSEHARGRAIDISSVILMDGTVITVRDGWANEDTKGAMRELHSGACGLFGTVLGPDADRYHRGHFHFDTARRNSGPYCR